MSTKAFPYQVLEEFNRGGCSIIYKVKPLQDRVADERTLVLKTMDPNDAEPQSGQRFYMEYEFLRAYPHPNLIEVMEYFADYQGGPAYIMEWIEGQTWQDHWQDRQVLEAIPEFLDLFRQLCEVLDFIHKHQIIHRDLKPQNILVSNQGRLVLIDFGIMKVADMTMYTHRNTFMGSAYYVSPEGISGETVDHTADIFALGVMVYDLFTGMKPFKGPTLGETIYQRLVKKPQPPSRIAELPEALDPIILKMLDRDPRKRPQSCIEIYRDLDAALKGFAPNPAAEVQRHDVLTQGPLLHSAFIKTLKEKMTDHKVVCVVGPAGSGKTTIVENLFDRAFGDAKVRLECRPGGSELEMMELILAALPIKFDENKELTRWLEILGNALPQLHWKNVRPTNQSLGQAIGHSTMLTAFKRVLVAVDTPFAIAIENLEEAAPALRQFALQIAQIVKSGESETLRLVISAGDDMPELERYGRVFRVPLPDVMDISEYLVSLYGPCRIPLDVTEALVRASDENVGAMLRLIREYRENDWLQVSNGVLEVADLRTELIDPDQVQFPADEESPIPPELKAFSESEIEVLRWIALCPNGLDITLLRKVTAMDLAELSSTIKKAGEMELMDFQSSSTEGFRWRNEEVSGWLVDSIPNDERSHRLCKLAQTIEDESQQFLSYSPPLWLILSRLYHAAGEHDKAGRYALNYARYSFQNGNYEPIRKYLSWFVPLPQFQSNQEFWSMLAMAFKDQDLSQALYFAKKSLQIEENVTSLSLAAILEYYAFNENQSHRYITKVFAQKNWKDQLTINSISQLLPILIAMDEVDKCHALFSLLFEKLKGRKDLFATDVLTLARIRLVENQPSRVINMCKQLKEELLPATESIVKRSLSIAYQELFRFKDAQTCLLRESDRSLDPEELLEWLFLDLNARRQGEVKKIIAKFRQLASESIEFERYAQLITLITEALLQDPKAFDADYILEVIFNARVDKSRWLVAITNTLDFRYLDATFLDRTLTVLETAASPWAQNQIPRLKIVAALKNNDLKNLQQLWQIAVRKSEDYGLLLEKLRLYGLSQFQRRILKNVPAPHITFSPGFLDNLEVMQYLSSLIPK